MLVIFDCDGVLVDSEPISNRILAAELTAIGLPTSAEDSTRDFMGRSWASCTAIIEERLGRELPPGFAADYQAALFATFDASLEPVAGIEGVLDRVSFPYCVASSGSHERIRRALGVTGLLERFEGRIFSATEVAHGKPAPDLFLHAAARMGFEPERCVVIEDAPAGVQAALAAGMSVLGYAGRTPAAQLEGAQTFADMAELARLLSLDPPIPAVPRHRGRSPEPIGRKPGGPPHE